MLCIPTEVSRLLVHDRQLLRQYFHGSRPPVLAHLDSQRTSQPFSIDGGGNIFFLGGDTDCSDRNTGATRAATDSTKLSSRQGEIHRLVRHSSVRRGDCSCKKIPRTAVDRELDNNSATGAARISALHHVGGVLRCRSVGASSRGFAHRDGGETTPLAETTRPTLRAYSAPLFLHSTIFPPKNRVQTGRGMSTVETTDERPNCDGRYVTFTRQKEAQGQVERTAAVPATETTVAPSQHRLGGYLHKFMGFEQERVSSPPVESFRVVGGLGDFPRKEATLARRRARTDRSASARSESRAATAQPPGGRRNNSGDSLRLHERKRSILDGGVGPRASHEQAYHLGLFADGSTMAPISPPGDRHTFPVWCSRSKRRPGGAKEQKVWGACGWEVVPGSGVHEAGGKTRSGGSSRGLVSGPASGADYSSAFLPYALERPVSPERAQAFSYTCN